MLSLIMECRVHLDYLFSVSFFNEKIKKYFCQGSIQSKPLSSSRFFKLSICFGDILGHFHNNTNVSHCADSQCRLCNGLKDCGTS